jgi:hypothetical protein
VRCQTGPREERRNRDSFLFGHLALELFHQLSQLFVRFEGVGGHVLGLTERAGEVLIQQVLPNTLITEALVAAGNDDGISHGYLADWTLQLLWNLLFLRWRSCVFGLRTSHSTCLLKQFLLVSFVICRVLVENTHTWISKHTHVHRERLDVAYPVGGTELNPVPRFTAAIADVSSGRRPSEESRVDPCLYWTSRVASGSHGRNTLLHSFSKPRFEIYRKEPF